MILVGLVNPLVVQGIKVINLLCKWDMSHACRRHTNECTIDCMMTEHCMKLHCIITLYRLLYVAMFSTSRL